MRIRSRLGYLILGLSLAWAASRLPGLKHHMSMFHPASRLPASASPEVKMTRAQMTQSVFQSSAIALLDVEPNISIPESQVVVVQFSVEVSKKLSLASARKLFSHSEQQKVSPKMVFSPAAEAGFEHVSVPHGFGWVPVPGLPDNLEFDAISTTVDSDSVAVDLPRLQTWQRMAGDGLLVHYEASHNFNMFFSKTSTWMTIKALPNGRTRILSEQVVFIKQSSLDKAKHIPFFNPVNMFVDRMKKMVQDIANHIEVSNQY